MMGPWRPEVDEGGLACGRRLIGLVKISGKPDERALGRGCGGSPIELEGGERGQESPAKIRLAADEANLDEVILIEGGPQLPRA